MRLDITAKNGRTGTPIEGATVTVTAESGGSSEDEEVIALGDDDEDEDGEFVRSTETVSNGEYSGRAAFEIASWVTRLDIEVSHERFEVSTIREVTPGLTDKHKIVELTPKLSDATISISEHFYEPAEVRIEPADEVIEGLYDSATNIELMPGETETFSFITGRYRFSIQNPPDNYVGKDSVTENLQIRDSPRIDFTQVDVEAEPVGPDGELEDLDEGLAEGVEDTQDVEDTEDEQSESVSLTGKFKELTGGVGDNEDVEDTEDEQPESVGLTGKFKEIISSNDSTSDSEEAVDPITDEDVENSSTDNGFDVVSSDEPHDAGAEEEHDENIEDKSVEEPEDDADGESEDEADGESEDDADGEPEDEADREFEDETDREPEDEADEESEDEAVGLGALFN